MATPTFEQLAIEDRPGQIAPAPGIDGGVVVGLNEQAKLGFFGQTPVERVQLAANADVAAVIAALVAYGLVTQAK